MYLLSGNQQVMQQFSKQVFSIFLFCKIKTVVMPVLYKHYIMLCGDENKQVGRIYMLQYGIIIIYCYFTIMDSFIIAKLRLCYSLIRILVLRNSLVKN